MRGQIYKQILDSIQIFEKKVFLFRISLIANARTIIFLINQKETQKIYS
jgi:hypothetical protein